MVETAMADILIVEDDLFFRELYADLLRQDGYTLQTACSGEEALEWLQTATCGLVMTDLTMPGISGLELLVKIKSQDPSIDVILVTANADLESALFCLKHGARDFLQKPVNPDELRHTVRLCMQQRRLLDENLELRNMLGLLQTSQTLSNCLDLEGVCHLAVDALAREVGVGRGMGLVLQDGVLAMKGIKGIGTSTAESLYKRLLPLVRKRLSRKGKPVCLALSAEDGELEQHGFHEMVLFPLVAQHGCLGMVALFNDQQLALPLLKNERNLSFLQEQVTRSLENALRFSSTREMLYVDELSGLFNYRYLNVALEREIKRAERYATRLSVLFLDLDNFKTVNDTYGHLVGSNLLKELGTLLKKSVREVDVVIRYGGDEYTIILVETGPEGAHLVGERIRKKIEKYQFMAQDGYHIQLTASLGYASYPEDTAGTDQLLAMADKAMYASKAAGKNCVYRIVSPLADSGVLSKEQQ